MKYTLPFHSRGVEWQGRPIIRHTWGGEGGRWTFTLSPDRPFR